MAYSKQTWDTTSYVNPTRMNYMEDGIENANSAADTLGEDVERIKSDLSTLNALFIPQNLGSITIEELLTKRADNIIGVYKIDAGCSANPVYTEAGIPWFGCRIITMGNIFIAVGDADGGSWIMPSGLNSWRKID